LKFSTKPYVISSNINPPASARQIRRPNSRFTESLDNDPRYAASWREWAISLYDQERYSEAWVKVKQARANRAEPFPPNFLKKLSDKMPEPQ